MRFLSNKLSKTTQGNITLGKFRTRNFSAIYSVNRLWLAVSCTNSVNILWWTKPLFIYKAIFYLFKLKFFKCHPLNRISWINNESFCGTCCPCMLQHRGAPRCSSAGTLCELRLFTASTRISPLVSAPLLYTRFFLALSLSVSLHHSAIC